MLVLTTLVLTFFVAPVADELMLAVEKERARAPPGTQATSAADMYAALMDDIDPTYF